MGRKRKTFLSPCLSSLFPLPPEASRKKKNPILMSLHGKIISKIKDKKKGVHPNNPEGEIKTVLGCLRAVIKTI